MELKKKTLEMSVLGHFLTLYQHTLLSFGIDYGNCLHGVTFFKQILRKLELLLSYSRKDIVEDEKGC